MAVVSGIFAGLRTRDYLDQSGNAGFSMLQNPSLFLATRVAFQRCDRYGVKPYPASNPRSGA